MLGDLSKLGVEVDEDSVEKKNAARLRRIYKALFSEKCPYQFQFGVLGYCDHFAKVILLEAPDISDKGDFETAIHEMVHMRFPELKHGKRFVKKVNKLVKAARKVI